METIKKIETKVSTTCPNYDNLESLEGEALQDASTELLLSAASTMTSNTGKAFGKLYRLWQEANEIGNTKLTFGEWLADKGEVWANECIAAHNIHRGLSLDKLTLVRLFGPDTDMSPIMLTCARQIYGTAKNFNHAQKVFKGVLKIYGSVAGLMTSLKSLEKTRAA